MRIAVFALCLTVIAPCAFVHGQEKKAPKSFTNEIGMEFVWISSGTFLMGRQRDFEWDSDPDEIPHKVTITTGFYMGKYLVTQEHWKKVMNSEPSKFKGEKNLPVDNVSWDQCQKFIKELRKVSAKQYRLPTEAEWEYACRAGTNTPFYFGETVSTDQANYNGNEVYPPFDSNVIKAGKVGVFRKKTTPVGSFPPNGWGLYDMHGNLFQWCHDWYGEYPSKDVVDPQGPKSGKERVIRGGCWLEVPGLMRSAYRGSCPPDDALVGALGTGGLNGFRVCFIP